MQSPHTFVQETAELWRTGSTKYYINIYQAPLSASHQQSLFHISCFCALAVRTFMNDWLLMGHWLFQSQQEWGEGAAGSPMGTQTCGRSIIHGSPWACSEHWHPTCLNQTAAVSLMPLGKCEAQVKVGRVEGSSGGDGEGQIRKERKEGWRGRKGMASLLTPVALAWKLSAQ